MDQTKKQTKDGMEIYTMQDDIKEVKETPASQPQKEQSASQQSPPPNLPVADESKPGIEAPSAPPAKPSPETAAKLPDPPMPPEPPTPPAEPQPTPQQPPPAVSKPTTSLEPSVEDAPKPDTEEKFAEEKTPETEPKNASKITLSPDEQFPIPEAGIKWTKILIPVVSVVIILGVAGGAAYWWFFVKSTPIIPEPIAPVSLISADSTKIIKQEEFDKIVINKEIRNIAKEQTNSGKFTRILVEISNKDGKRYITNDELYDSLNISIPSNIKEGISGDSTLFSYGQKNGTRLGLAFKIKEGADYNNLNSDLKAWENTMAKALDGLFLMSKGDEASEKFLDNTYKNLSIRYVNFPNPDTTIDYTAYENENLLLITTSKESMYALIDQFIPEAPSATDKPKSEGIDITNWLTYKNEVIGIEIKYDPNFTPALTATTTVEFTNKDNSEKTVIIRQKNIPRPALPETSVEELDINGIPAKLYHDQDAKTGTKIDKIIFDIPNSDEDLYISKQGKNINALLITISTLKLI